MCVFCQRRTSITIQVGKLLLMIWIFPGGQLSKLDRRSIFGKPPVPHRIAFALNCTDPTAQHGDNPQVVFSLGCLFDLDYGKMVRDGSQLLPWGKPRIIHVHPWILIGETRGRLYEGARWQSPATRRGGLVGAGAPSPEQR